MRRSKQVRWIPMTLAAVVAAVVWGRRSHRPLPVHQGGAGQVPAPPTGPRSDEMAAPGTAPARAAGRPLRRSVVALLATAVVVQLLVGIAAAVPLAAAKSDARPLPPRAFEVRAPTRPARESAPTDAPVADPVRLEIPRLEIAAPVDAVGLQADGTMSVPDDVSRTGWYDRLEAPGETGTAVIVGHLDSRTGPGVFFELPTLEPGDEIIVRRADDTVARFVVERTEQYDKRQFPTIAVYAPTDRPTLRLITCGGSFDKSSRSYSDNIVVYATQESP